MTVWTAVWTATGKIALVCRTDPAPAVSLNP